MAHSDLNHRQHTQFVGLSHLSWIKAITFTYFILLYIYDSLDCVPDTGMSQIEVQLCKISSNLKRIINFGHLYFEEFGFGMETLDIRYLCQRVFI